MVPNYIFLCTWPIHRLSATLLKFLYSWVLLIYHVCKEKVGNKQFEGNHLCQIQPTWNEKNMTRLSFECLSFFLQQKKCHYHQKCLKVSYPSHFILSVASWTWVLNGPEWQWLTWATKSPMAYFIEHFIMNGNDWLGPQNPRWLTSLRISSWMAMTSLGHKFPMKWTVCPEAIGKTQNSIGANFKVI